MTSLPCDSHIPFFAIVQCCRSIKKTMRIPDDVRKAHGVTLEFEFGDVRLDFLDGCQVWICFRGGQLEMSPDEP